jgi:uncharacterized membrane protein YdfJ with MMPL/SSD domain
MLPSIGLGLAVGVLLDTFGVRTLLVPSAVVVLGRWNWWPSRLSRPLAPGRGHGGYMTHDVGHDGRRAG